MTPQDENKERRMTSFEVVLPSGTFARVRTILVADMVAFSRHEGIAAMAILAQRVTEFDGKSLTVEELLGLPFGELQPVFEALNAQLKAAYTTRLGIA